MADLKISQLNSLAGSSLANTDVLAVVDTSASETKKITSKELVQYGYGLVDPSTLDGDIIEPGTTSARGTVQLTDSTGSTSTTTAATPNAVKTAFDLANAALPKAGGTMTGQILGDDSTSASTPGYAFDGDPDTGLLRTGANELGLVTGGTSRLTIDASGNVVIPGNFTVQGTTTTIDTTTLVVEDKNIEMGAVATPSDVTADGGGITLKGTTDKTINWVDATDAWTSSERFSVPTGTAAAPTLTFTGDPNTGIYSPGADQLALSTNGTGRLFVDSSGRVGIGNALPDRSLTVQEQATGAAINLLSTTGNGGGVLGTTGEAGSDNGLLLNANRGSGKIIFQTVGSERLRITSAGLVGIGTSSPVTPLDVRGSALFNAENAFWGYDATTDPRIGFIKQSGSAPFIGLGSATSFQISHSSGTGINSPSTQTYTPRFTIDTTGRVGIGTTSPGNLLHLYGSNAIQNIEASATTVASYIKYAGGGSDRAYLGVERGDGGGGIIGSGAYAFVVSTASTNPLVFGTNGTERARIDSSGRLLVGTSSARTIGVVPIFQIEGTGAVAGAFKSLVLNRNTDAAGPRFAFGRTRGTANGQFTAVQSGDSLGDLRWYGADGTTLEPYAAEIRCEVDGTPGTNDMPGRLVFSTTADGASSPTERMRIAQNGVITIQNGAVAVIGTLTDAATITPDFAADCNFTVTLGGNRTIANPTNLTAGQSGSIFLVQDATGGRTASWGSYWDFPGGTAPTLSTAANAVDRVDYIVRSSTSIHTVFTANYS